MRILLNNFKLYMYYCYPRGMDEDEIEDDVAYEEILEGENGSGDELQDCCT